MDQNSNPENNEDNVTPSQETGGPPTPPSYNDPAPPAYGDPLTPPPAGPPPVPPPPGLDPGPASAPPPPNAGSTGSLTSPSKDERNWAMFAHVSAIVTALVLSLTSIPAFGFLGPLVIYLMKKDESPFVADQAKEALNFNISVGIVLFVMWLFAMALIWTIVIPFIMFPLMGLVGLAALVMIIIAAMKASNGELYRYPFTLRLIK